MRQTKRGWGDEEKKKVWLVREWVENKKEKKSGENKERKRGEKMREEIGEKRQEERITR